MAFRQMNPNLPFHRAPIERRTNVGYGPGARGPIPPGGGADAQNDPLGLGVKSRGMQTRLAAAMLEHAGPGNNLPMREWEGFKQALAERGVDRLAGGPSAEGSNQIRGTSVQPNYVGFNASRRLRDMGEQQAGRDPVNPYGNAGGEAGDKLNKDFQRSRLEDEQNNYGRAIAALRGLMIGRR